MSSNNPRWDPGFLTGIYTHKKFAKTCLSESTVGEINNNGETKGLEGLKIIVESEDLEVVSVRFGEFINAFKFKSLYLYINKDTVYRKVSSF